MLRSFIFKNGTQKGSQKNTEKEQKAKYKRGGEKQEPRGRRSLVLPPGSPLVVACGMYKLVWSSGVGGRMNLSKSIAVKQVCSRELSVTPPAVNLNKIKLGGGEIKTCFTVFYPHLNNWLVSSRRSIF